MIFSEYSVKMETIVTSNDQMNDSLDVYPDQISLSVGQLVYAVNL